MLPPWDFKDPSCRDIGTDLFFPPEGPEGNFRSTKQEDPEILSMIKRLCSQCVERKNCLEWALHNENYGTWAGYSSQELNRIRRERKIIVKEEDVA